MTFHPRLENSLAAARPRPDELPVMKMVLGPCPIGRSFRHSQAGGSGIIGAGLRPLPATRSLRRPGLAFRFRLGWFLRFMPSISRVETDASKTSLLSYRCQ
jgi:hypothetical protein